MLKQTLLWTALPNGSSGPLAAGSTLRLSVYISPRLWNDDPTVTSMNLGAFPDFLDWPSRLNAAAFQVAFDGGPTLPAAIASPAARLDLWQALFKPGTLVKPYHFEDLSGAEILSFPAAEIHDTLKGVYQRAATDPAYGAGLDLPAVDVLARDPDLKDIARPTDLKPYEQPTAPDKPVQLDEPEEKPGPGGKGCCLLFWLFIFIGLFRRLFKLLLKLLGVSLAVPLASAMIRLPEMRRPDGPGGGPPGAGGPAAAPLKKAAFDELNAYLAPHDVVSHPLPTQAEIDQTYDFHAMCSAAGDYPALLRLLGLVVDLEVTLGDDLPAPVGMVKVQPTAGMGVPTTHYTPRTHYELGAERFLTRPRPGANEHNAGLLRLDDGARFRVIQTEVAGSGVKLQNMATNLASPLPAPPNSPKEDGLPALQTAGISVVRPGLALKLGQTFLQSYALNAALAAVDGSPSPPPAAGAAPPPTDELYAEDVTRGYRVDVYDDKSKKWHSLCQRDGTYVFLDAAGETLALQDEGFVQLAATEQLNPAPGVRRLRLHESLFTWDGWSLCAPRPHKTIMGEDPVTGDTLVGDTPNTAATPFRMEANFRAHPGSLPRLRFGYSYRLRARLADLAGNSVFYPGDAAFAADPTEATPSFKFNRFEPISPPPLLLRSGPKEGESLESLVVRSPHDALSADPTDNATERHVLPPKTSQAMVERHSIFDVAGGMLKDAAAYALACREAGTLTHRYNPATASLDLLPGVAQVVTPEHAYWLQANEQHEVTYLPDPHARGVLLLGLPGMASFEEIVEPGGLVVNKIPFEGAWPDLKPFRLRLVGILAGQAPAQPAWNAAARLLEVQLPQGETARVRISSYFSLADLQDKAIWEWMRDAAPADLAELEKQAAAGRNWLHLPFRDLVLIHAVQRPLDIPAIASLEVPQTPGPDPDFDRPLGDTSALLSGALAVDGKSTGRVDLRAAWQDPFDDPGKPAYNSATDVVDHAMPVGRLEVSDPAWAALPVDKLRHTIGDTHYHRITYIATATTRFREFFPPAVTADPQNLTRPTPLEEGTPAAAVARKEVDIPNVARPDAPRLLYVVPTFAWGETVAGDVKTRRRASGGLRVYMERPWFSSGAGELLGVVVKRDGVLPTSPEDEALRKYASEWGMDPIWPAESTAPLRLADLPSPAASASGLSLDERPEALVNAAGYAPGYDTARDLWYCDIPLAPGRLYYPFVRLALVRFQPVSVRGAHLSRVVQADFIQLTPDRRVEYDLSALAGGSVPIKVSGPSYFFRRYERYGSPVVYAGLQSRQFPGMSGELGWETIAGATITLTPTQQAPEETIWEGVLPVPAAPRPLRLVVAEYELFLSGLADLRSGANVAGEATGRASFEAGGMVIHPNLPVGARLVFADAIEIA